MTTKKLFRATIADAASGSNFVIEFLAPYTVQATVDYEQIALSNLIALINQGVVKIRDIEPIEIKEVIQ